ncbi:uncharacterized protein LOC132546911 [Ylistrum balloti]|uniref:uncharacterized protein LOC132546911 n=1 Tax=Ylistrum balloti TaxID=509963 RepID=UPI00290581E4|nr:uncharacterized protein LOC132546911 [Ylistrum balloti]
MSEADFSCFGDICEFGREFCDPLSRFCINCATPPWNEKCFKSEHINNCTEFCKDLVLNNDPPNSNENEEEILMIEPECHVPVDPRPIQVSKEIILEADAVSNSTDYPKFGPTALKPHKEAILM